MSELPIPDWLGVSTASLLSTLEDTTDTLNPRPLLPDDQFLTNAPLYNNGSNGFRCNDSNALIPHPLLYEDPSLSFEIDMYPSVQPKTQQTDQTASFLATTGSSTGLQNVYQGYEFLSENVLSESVPGAISPIDTCHLTELAVDNQCPASDHTEAAVKFNGPTDPAQKMSKRSSVDAETLICDWPGCERRRQPFNRLQDLRRHRKYIHESPGSYVCTYDGCHHISNRPDNLQQHIRRRHMNAANANESP